MNIISKYINMCDRIALDYTDKPAVKDSKQHKLVINKLRKFIKIIPLYIIATLIWLATEDCNIISLRAFVNITCIPIIFTTAYLEIAWLIQTMKLSVAIIKHNKIVKQQREPWIEQNKEIINSLEIIQSKEIEHE